MSSQLFCQMAVASMSAMQSSSRALRKTCSQASAIVLGTSPVIRMTSAVKGTA